MKSKSHKCKPEHSNVTLRWMVIGRRRRAVRQKEQKEVNRKIAEAWTMSKRSWRPKKELEEFEM